MKKRLWLAFAMSASLASFGAYAEGDQNSDSSAGAPGGGAMSFSSLDEDKDGMISKSEAKKDQSLSDQFKAVDTDSDGKLSETEFQTYSAGASGGGGGGSDSPSSGK
jgi:hypothetical protein